MKFLPKIPDHIREGVKNPINQHPVMQEMLEDRNKTVAGLYRMWNRISPDYRMNYDQIRWNKDANS